MKLEITHEEMKRLIQMVYLANYLIFDSDAEDNEKYSHYNKLTNKLLKIAHDNNVPLLITAQWIPAKSVRE